MNDSPPLGAHPPVAPRIGAALARALLALADPAHHEGSDRESLARWASEELRFALRAAEEAAWPL